MIDKIELNGFCIYINIDNDAIWCECVKFTHTRLYELEIDCILFTTIISPHHIDVEDDYCSTFRVKY